MERRFMLLLMGLCRLQKSKCGAVVKDDSVSYAVFTEQGFSASHMTAAKVLDVLSRLPDCAGEASDAISVHVQVKIEDTRDLWALPNIRMSNCLDTFMCAPRKLFISLCLCGRNKNRGKERKEEKTEVLCGESWKTLILNNLTPPLDQVFLGCAERVCKTNKRIVRKNRKLFESLISADTAKPLPDWEPSLSDTVPWSYDVEGHSKKCVERKYDLSNKKIANYSKFAPPVLMTINFKRGNWRQLENYPEYTRRLFQYVFLARSSRRDILWSVSNLARAITKWSKACDRRLVWLISYIHCASGYGQYCRAGNTVSQCKLRLLQDADFTDDLTDSKSTSRGVPSIFGSHTFVPDLTVVLKQKWVLWTLVCVQMNSCIWLVGHYNSCFRTTSTGRCDTTFQKETVNVKEQQCEATKQKLDFVSECKHFQPTCVPVHLRW